MVPLYNITDTNPDFTPSSRDNRFPSDLEKSAKEDFIFPSSGGINSSLNALSPADLLKYFRYKQAIDDGQNPEFAKTTKAGYYIYGYGGTTGTSQQQSDNRVTSNEKAMKSALETLETRFGGNKLLAVANMYWSSFYHKESQVGVSSLNTCSNKDCEKYSLANYSNSCPSCGRGSTRAGNHSQPVIVLEGKEIGKYDPSRSSFTRGANYKRYNISENGQVKNLQDLFHEEIQKYFDQIVQANDPSLASDVISQIKYTNSKGDARLGQVFDLSSFKGGNLDIEDWTRQSFVDTVISIPNNSERLSLCKVIIRSEKTPPFPNMPTNPELVEGLEGEIEKISIALIHGDDIRGSHQGFIELLNSGRLNQQQKNKSTIKLAFEYAHRTSFSGRVVATELDTVDVTGNTPEAKKIKSKSLDEDAVNTPGYAGVGIPGRYKKQDMIYISPIQWMQVEDELNNTLIEIGSEEYTMVGENPPVGYAMPFFVWCYRRSPSAHLRDIENIWSNLRTKNSNSNAWKDPSSIWVVAQIIETVLNHNKSRSSPMSLAEDPLNRPEPALRDIPVNSQSVKVDTVSESTPKTTSNNIKNRIGVLEV